MGGAVGGAALPKQTGKLTWALESTKKLSPKPSQSSRRHAALVKRGPYEQLLKGGYIRKYMGEYHRVFNGDTRTRSLVYVAHMRF